MNMEKSFVAYAAPAYRYSKKKLVFICIIVLTVFAIVYLSSCNCKPPNSVCIQGTRETPFAEFYSVSQSYNVYKVLEKLYTKKSAFQLIEVWSTSFFGNLLVIDGDVMLTERDEKHYHEMIVHVPLNYLPKASTVLIIGGGDGGTLREVLKHPNINTVTMIEIDEEVVLTSKKYFPKLATGFEDSRAQIIHQDGAVWVQEQLKKESGTAPLFDVAIVDSTDYNAAITLFTDKFYANLKRLLKPNGILVFNVDSPSFALSTIRNADIQMREIFSKVFHYQVFQPTYLSGHYAFLFASDKIHPFETEIDWNAWHEKKLDCHYYNPDVHYASFVLPNFMQVVLRENVALSQIPASGT